MIFKTFRILLSRGWRNVMYSVSLLVLSMLSVNSNAQAVSDSPGIRTTQSKVVVSGIKPSAGDMISGLVISETEGPMMLARVEEKDSNDRTVANAVTDINGKFSFRLVNPADRMEVIYLGYLTAVSEFTGNTMDVKMLMDPQIMITEVDSSLAAVMPVIVREDRFQGMRARAYGPQYPKDGKPLIVLDGCIMDVSSVNMQCLDSLMSGKLHVDKENIARLFGLKEYEIKSVSVLKDAAATAIWGTRGANGVIEVTSKKGWAKRMERNNPDVNKYAWESINDEILKENAKTELNSLPGDGLYIPSDNATYYSIEDLYNNWILK